MYKDEKTHAADDRCPDYASHTKSNHAAMHRGSAPARLRAGAAFPPRRYSTTVFRNSDAVIKNRHIAVLDIIFIFFNWPFLHQSRQMLNNLFFVPAHTYHSLISIAIFSILTHPFNSHHIFLLSIFKYLCRCHLL